MKSRTVYAIIYALPGAVIGLYAGIFAAMAYGSADLYTHASPTVMNTIISYSILIGITAVFTLGAAFLGVAHSRLKENISRTILGYVIPPQYLLLVVLVIWLLVYLKMTY
jgi:hypothetical protein